MDKKKLLILGALSAVATGSYAGGKNRQTLFS